jgi:hypothetical protein
VAKLNYEPASSTPELALTTTLALANKQNAEKQKHNVT